MRYPVAIHHEEDTAYGVTVPDIPGCFSAGDTMDEALENTVEAITGHLSILAEDGVPAPSASSIDAFVDHEDYEGAIWGFVEVDVTAFSGKTEKINVTLPSILISRIQDEVANGRAKNRSAFLTDAAISKLG